VKPTVKVLITGPGESDVIEFVRVLSATELSEHEKKVPNPFSATKEETLLLPLVGRVEWEDLAVQMQALTAYKRFDFAWPALLRGVYGVIVLLRGAESGEVDETRRLLKLFRMMQQSNCLVAVKERDLGDDADLTETGARLETTYPMAPYIPDGGDSEGDVLRAWVDIVPPPQEPTRRRARSSAGDKRE
jgi:signal recognition particle receptor subunit beta